MNFEEMKNQILIEHNLLRSDPTSYIPLLEEQIKFFKGDVLYKPNELAVRTSEGKEAYFEAIEFLKKQQPLNILTHDQMLANASSDHVNDIGPKGIISHEGSDGNNLSDRIEKYTEWDGTCCENIDFGNKIASNVLISLLVDDGIMDRPHRKNIFSEQINFVGISCGVHKEYEVLVVISYTARIREIGKSYFDSNNLKYEYPKTLNNYNTKQDKNSNSTSGELSINRINANVRKKNEFQIDDPDAPDNTKAVSLIKTTKIYDNKPRKVTKKIYSLHDGTKYIVEIEET